MPIQILDVVVKKFGHIMMLIMFLMISDDDQGTTVEDYINSRRKGPRINIKKI